MLILDQVLCCTRVQELLFVQTVALTSPNGGSFETDTFLYFSAFIPAHFRFIFFSLPLFQINDRRLGTSRISDDGMIIATNGAIKEFGSQKYSTA